MADRAKSVTRGGPSMMMWSYPRPGAGQAGRQAHAEGGFAYATFLVQKPDNHEFILSALACLPFYRKAQKMKCAFTDRLRYDYGI